MHGEKVFNNLLVMATITTMAKWINREIDTVLPGTFEMQKNSSEFIYKTKN